MPFPEFLRSSYSLTTAYRLVRSHDTLAEARLLLTNDHVRTAVNRVYYADLVTFDRADVGAWIHEAEKFVEQVARSVEGFPH